MIKRKKNIVQHKENGGYVVLNMDNGDFYGLYDISQEIWDMLDGDNNVDDIVEKLNKKYSEISAAEIRSDVEAFVNKLMSVELVEIYG